MNEMVPLDFAMDIDVLSDDQVDILQTKLIARRMQRHGERIELLENENKKMNAKIQELEDSNKNILNEQKEIAKQVYILRAPKFHRQLKKLKEMVRKRKEYIYGDHDSMEYVLFEPFFRQGIYATIASQLSIGSWLNISMIDYQSMDSDYEKSKNIIENWYPSRSYLNHCIDELVKKRDRGTLPPVRCRALTEFLHTTSNGKNVWFVKG